MGEGGGRYLDRGEARGGHGGRGAERGESEALRGKLVLRSRRAC